MHFLELPKFFEQHKFDTNLKNWLAYFKDEGKEEKIMKTVMNTIMKNNPAIKKAHNEFKKFTEDEKLMDIYQARMRRQRQYASDLKYSEDKGIEQGIEKQKIISDMEHTEKRLRKKQPWSFITDITGITEKQNLEWKKKTNSL